MHHSTGLAARSLLLACAVALFGAAPAAAQHGSARDAARASSAPPAAAANAAAAPAAAQGAAAGEAGPAAPGSTGPAAESPRRAAGFNDAELPWLLVGGRVGLEYAIMAPAEFNTEVQAFYPGSHAYFPLYSLLGAAVTERIPIADTGYRVLLTELPLVYGFDQNFALVSCALLAGVQSWFGLEVMLGPKIEPVVGSVGMAPGLSMVYSAGWRFTIGRVSFPVSVLVDPLPPDRKVRLALVAGVDYGFRPTLPKRRAPFNY